MANITIADVRAKYPQYDKLSDQDLADKLHAKFYPQLDRADFYGRVGLAASTVGSGSDTAGFSNELLETMRKPVPSPANNPRQAAGDTAGGPLSRIPAPGRVAQPTIAVPQASHERPPLVDLTTPPSPPPTPRAEDHIPFGMMGGSSAETEAWARREIARQMTEAGNGQNGQNEGLLETMGGFVPTPPNYTPTGEAILSELGNVPERVQRGFAGNTLAGAEIGLRSTLDTIKRTRNVADDLAAARAQLAQKRAAYETADGLERPTLYAEINDLSQRISQLERAASNPEHVAQVQDAARQRMAEHQRDRAEAQSRIDDLEAQMTPVNAKPGLSRAVVSGISSIADMAPGLVTTLATRNPLPMMVYLGAYSRGSTYADKRAEGYNSEKAASAANLYAAAETIPELLPLHVILKEGGSALSKIAGGAATEAVSEVMTQGLQTLVDMGVLDERMTWGEARDAMTESGMAGGVMGGLMGGGAVLADNVGESLQNRRAKKGTPADPNAIAPAQRSAPGEPETPREQPAPIQAPRPEDDLLATMQPASPPQAPQSAPEKPPAPPVEAAPQSRADQEKPQEATGSQSKPPEPTDGNFEILDEVETVDGETRPTGRKVRVDLTTGEASLVDAEEAAGTAPAGAPADRGTQPDSQPQDAGGALVGAQPDSAAGGARPAPQRRFLSHEETLAIETDPGTFQYKGGSDSEGVTSALQGVTKFDPNRAGQVVLFQTRDGRLIVADGHQRTGLARRMAQAGQGDVGGMAAVVYREADGYTPEEVMALAALKNIGEGSGTAVDAARILRTRSGSIEDMGLPPQSALVRNAEGLRRLSDQAFGMVVNGKASEQHGAIVGRVVTNRDAQIGILGLLTKLNPSNAFQAESIARQAAEEVTTETQSSLFGDEEIAANLYLERAKILDNAVKRLRDEKRLFGTLTDRIEAITAAGNVLAKDENARRLDAADRMRDYLTSQANVKGPISEALSAAARDIKAGTPVGQATGRFLEALKRELEGDGGRGAETPGRGGVDQGAEKGGSESVAPPQDDLLAAMGAKPAAEAKPAPKPPAPAGNDLLAMMGAKPQKDPTPAARAEAEAKVKAAQSKKGTTAPQGDAGPLFDTQGDIEKAPAQGGAAGQLRAHVKAMREKYNLSNIKGFDNLDNSSQFGVLLDQIAAVGGLDARTKVATDWVRSEGKETGVEHLVILDNAGRPLVVGMGQKDAVNFPQGIMDMASDGLISVLTHNHPSSRGFSLADLKAMIGPLHGAQVIATGHNGMVINMTPGPVSEGIVGFDRNSGEMIEFTKVYDLTLKDMRVFMQRKITPVLESDKEGLKVQKDRVDFLNQHWDAVYNAALDRIGVISYSGDALELARKEQANNENLADIDIDEAIAEFADAFAHHARIRRSGLDIAEIERRIRDHKAESAPANAGRDGGTGTPEPASGKRNGDGRVRGSDQVAKDDFGGALDDVYGAEKPAPQSSSISIETLRNWRNSVPSTGTVSGWTVFDDTEIGSGWVLMSKDQRVGPFATEATAREWAKDNAAKSGMIQMTPAPRSSTDIAKDLGDLFNEPGDRVKARVTGTPAFKRWFEDSKVVDENGDPRVVYHGTAHDFHIFQPDYGMTWASEGTKLPVLYADSSAYYADRNNEGGNIIPLFMSIKQPFNADLGLSKTVNIDDMLNALVSQAQDLGVTLSETQKARMLKTFDIMNNGRRREESGPHYDRHDFWYEAESFFGRDGKKAFFDAMEMLGFDGITMVENGEQTWGALKPTQVKSAFNGGEFDPTDPNMLAEPGDAFDTDKYAKAVPLFTEALRGIDVANMPRRDVFIAMIRPLAAAGLKRDAVAKMRPYFDQFLADLDSGKITLDQEGQDAPGTGGDLERDRGDAGSQDRVGKADVPAAGRGNGRGARARGATSDGRGGERAGGERLSPGDAAPVGAGRDQGVQGDGRPGRQPADGRDGAAGRDAGQPRVSPDDGPAGATGEVARNSPAVTDRIAAQRAADEKARRGIKLADEQNVRDTLPLLLPSQQDDVVKIEKRFLKPDGHGMLLTNGTGTGKTYSGGGVIKRFAQQGRENILVLAPSHGILDHWVEALRDLGIKASKLDSTADAGKGIVVTTYANAGVNNALAGRDWDLVVSDEAHKLSQNATGDSTDALNAIRAITGRPQDLWRKSHMIHAAEWDRLKAMKDGEAKTAEAHRLYEQQRADVEAFGKKPRSKVLFLSATPFAYDKNVDYAEGYLFTYGPDGHVGNSRQDGRNLFFVQNFGYRIRYHKLTKPDANVDSGVFEREFHEKLRREGVLSGRHLEIEPDYERRFVQREDAQGSQIDEVMSFVREQAFGKGPDKDVYSALLKSINRNFNYLRRMQLLEAIKAKAARVDIDKHLGLGRKVVIFHDYNVGGGFNPFRPGAGPDGPADQSAYEGYAALIAARPEAEDLNFAGYLPPVQELKNVYGDRAVVYNGTISARERAKAKADFNKDGSGVDVMIVQSAAGEAGISLHDVTGGHQRALINLGMPTRPTTALQEEGRIRREGSVSDALFHYYTIGTTWERQAFARKIAERSGTVENLALGNEARTIRDSFIEAYEDASPWEPSETDGKGGKERDRSVAKATPYEIAKTHYFGRTKTKGRRDQREGIDFYATPEPLGFKMVEWAGIRPYERVLEPSAGDAAIARYFPEYSDRTIIEPSSDLMSRALLRAVGAKGVQGTFEDYHIVNKHHVIVMNPPFGSGGKTAMEHLAKAAKHLRPGGRIVALIPTGPAADKRFDAWFYGDEAKNLHLTANVALPAVTFEKASTSVMARVVVIDNPAKGQEVASGTATADLTNAKTIAELFNRLENLSLRARPDPVIDAADEIMDEAEQADPERAAPLPIGAPIETGGFTLGKTKHAKTGDDLFVATAKVRVERDAYMAMLAVAKRHGGWYSSFRGNGAIPGFQFKSEAARVAFVEDMEKPTTGFEQPAWHGSPHTFDRFSTEFMGSGEGAQAFGWGLYFAGRKDVGEYYRDTLSQRAFTLIVDGERITMPDKRSAGFAEYTAAQRAAVRVKQSMDEGMGVDHALLWSRNALRSAEIGDLTDFQIDGGWGDVEKLRDVVRIIEGWRGADIKVEKGRLYKVDIPEDSDLLAWDAPLSEQPEKVREALSAWFPEFLGDTKDKSEWIEHPETNITRRSWIDQYGWQIVDHGGFFAVISPANKSAGGNSVAEKKTLREAQQTANAARAHFATNLTAKDAYYVLSSRLGGDASASKALRDAGIPGHRFLDQGSRGQGDGTYNYVIYDDKAVEITGFEESQDQFEPQPVDIIRAQMPALRAELDRLDLKRVRLFHDEKNMLDLPEGTQGMFMRNRQGSMAIVVAASLDPMKTVHHEVIHALRSMNLFTPQEWRALEIKAARTWVEQFDIVARYPNLMPSEQIEEGIAEAFAEAAAAQKPPSGSLLARAFNKIARFLKALRNVLSGAGFQTPEDVFGRVLAGSMARRGAGDTGALMAFQDGERKMQAARVPSRQARAHMASALGTAAYIPDRRVWEELTRAGAPIWTRLREGLGAANDAVDKARIKLQDRFLPVLRAQEAVMRMTGAPLSADQNAYVAETTFSGKAGRHLFEIDENFVKPIIALIAKSKGDLSVDYVGSWLMARHAVERNAHIAKINPKMPDGGSGMMTADAQQILADAAAGPHAQELQEIGDIIDRLRERTLKLREDAGLITHADAQLWRTQYRHYVPLKGFADTDHSEAVLDLTGVGRRFNVRGAETQRALGRSSEAYNPLQAAITQAQEVAIRAEKNRVGQALYNLAKDFPSPALWSVKKVKMKRFYNRTTGLVETRPEDPVSLFMDPNEMAVKVSGEEYRILFHDPRLAQAAGSVGADRLGWFMSVMSMAARYFSSINTMLDPEFVIRNAFRDMTAAQINIRNFGEGDRNAIAKAMIKNWPKAFVGAFRGQANKADTEWTRYYKEFDTSGAKVSFWRLEQPEAGKADLEKRVRMAGGSKMGPASRFVRFSTRDNPVLGFIERTNLAVDNAIRLAAFVEARKRGWSKGDAATLAKNLTVNFNRRGEWGATINALYPFANASIQGTQILFRAMTSKRMAKYAVGMVALGLILDAVNASLSSEDDDGELAYDKIPDWKSQTNLAVMLGPDSESAASVWLPYGYSLFPYLGQQIGKVRRGVKDPRDALHDFALATFGAFSPITGQTLQSTITPTMLDPINEMAMNEDWLGHPIRPENAYADYGPDAYKFYAGASEASKQLADIANRVTGGTEAESGLVDVSPEYIDHFFGFMTGGAGRTTGRVADVLAKSVGGKLDEIELRDVPVARSLVYDTGDWLDRDRFYRFRDEVKEAHASAKIYREEGKPVPKSVARMDALYSDLLAAEKELRGIRKAGEGDQVRVYLAFNKRFIRVAGPQGE